MSYGPARAGCGGNIVTYNSLRQPNHFFVVRKKMKTMGDRLMELLPHIDRDALAMDQKTILKKINQIQGSPHLLSYPEMLFLATAQKKAGVAPETLSVNEMKFLENTAAGEIKNAA